MGRAGRAGSCSTVAFLVSRRLNVERKVQDQGTGLDEPPAERKGQEQQHAGSTLCPETYFSTFSLDLCLHMQLCESSCLSRALLWCGWFQASRGSLVIIHDHAKYWEGGCWEIFASYLTVI